MYINFIKQLNILVNFDKNMIFNIFRGRDIVNGF